MWSTTLSTHPMYVKKIKFKVWTNESSGLLNFDRGTDCRSSSGNSGSGFQFVFLNIFSVKDIILITMFCLCNLCIKQKSGFFQKKYIIIILDDFYASLSRFLIFFATYGSTFPEMDPDPVKWYGSDWIRIRNT